MNWFDQLKKAEKSAILQGNLKKVHYAFEDGREMVEEYNTTTEVLTRRAWKIKTGLSGDGEWDIEVGDPEPAALQKGNELIRENSTQPFISRRLTKTGIEWRIRNLPYSPDIFTVTANQEENCLTVRTSNKKYFKHIPIPELQRIGLHPKQENVSFTHKFNTLIITYKKPAEYIDLEKAIYEEVKKVEPKMQGYPGDCKQT